MRKLLFVMLCFSYILGKTQPTSFFTITDLNMPDGDIFINYQLNEMDSSYEAVYGFNPIGPSPNFNFVGVFDKEGHFTHNKYFGPINLSYVQLYSFFYFPYTKAYGITGSYSDSTRQMIWPMNFFMDSTWQLVGMNTSDTVITWYESINDSIYSISGYISSNGTDRSSFVGKQNIQTFEISNLILVDSIVDSLESSLNVSLLFRRGFKIGFNYVLYFYDYSQNRYLLCSIDENGKLLSHIEMQTGTAKDLRFLNFFCDFEVDNIELKKIYSFDKNLNIRWSFFLDSGIYGNNKISSAIKYQENKILVISEVIDSTYIFTVLDTNGTVLKEVNIPQFHHDSIGRIFRINNGIETSDGGLLLQVRSRYNEQWTYLMKMDSNFHVLNSDCNFYILSHYNGTNEYVNDDSQSTGISLFPNPTTSHFTIQSSSNIKSLTVYNLQGQQVLQKSNLNATSFTVEEQLPSGVYVVKIETEEGVEERKVLVGSDNGQ